jgi:signal transduction histidine kinase
VRVPTVADPQLAGPGDVPDEVPLTSRRLVDAVDQPMALLDLRGRFLHANEAAADHLGLPRRELAGRTLAGLCGDAAMVEDALARWAGSSAFRPATLELTITPAGSSRQRCDGARLDADTLVLRLRDRETPDPLARLNHEIETASLRELQERLRTTLGELEDANRQLTAHNRELGRYASAVAHDLRTPVYIVRGYAELLHAGHLVPIDDEARRVVDEILRGTDRMSAVIDGLLTVARLQVTTPDEPASGADAVGVAVQELRAEIASTGGQVEVGPMATAWADATHLVQVFTNLIGNSLKFHAPGRAPTVRVSSERREGVTEFVVEDDGPGVPEADRDRIFDLFDRGGAAREQPGTGIGLATCRKLVESYGGTIRCEASELGGARFTFTIADPAVPTS